MVVLRSRWPSRSWMVRRETSSTDGPLDHRLVEVVATSLSRLVVDVETGGGEHPLPDPGPPGRGKLAGQGPGKLDPAGAAGDVGLRPRSSSHVESRLRTSR